MKRKLYILILIAPILTAFTSTGASMAQPHDTQTVDHCPDGAVSRRAIPGNSHALFLEKIVISGNSYLSDKRITDSMTLKPGDTLNVTALGRERRHILKENRLLTSVHFSTRPGSRQGFVILEIEVEEQQPVNFETGYGYHDTYGWFLTLLGLRLEQPFGTNSQLRFGLRMGFHVTGLDAEWKKYSPSEGGLGYGMKFYIYNEGHIFFGNQDIAKDSLWAAPYDYTWEGSRWRGFKQKIKRTGIETSLGYKVAGTHFSFGLKAESIEPDSTFLDVEMDQTCKFGNFPAMMKPDIKKTLQTGLFFRMVRDTRDNFIYPSNGSYTLLWIETSNTILGGDKVFTKLKFDHIKHINLGNYRVLAGRINAGLVSRGVPYYERFFIGGIYSIRGFKELSLSPTTGNDGYWIFSEELRFPLITAEKDPPRLSGLIFFDAGQGWQHNNAPTFKEIKSAAGYGIRLRLPWLGTLGLDVGIPLSESPNGDNFQIHGSLGFSF